MAEVGHLDHGRAFNPACQPPGILDSSRVIVAAREEIGRDALAIDAVEYSGSLRQILATCDSIDAVDTLIGEILD